MDIENQPRRWWAALLWALLSPVAGYLYIGRPLRALLAFLATFVVSAALMFDPTGWVATPTGYFSLGGGALALMLFFLVDAVAGALRRQEFRRRPWSRWFVYLAGAASTLFLVDLLALQPLIPRQGVGPFSIAASSNAPTLMEGDWIAVDRSVEPARDLRRGDMIVYLDARSGDVYVKRLIGLPGERVSLKDGVVSIDGAPLAQREIGEVAAPGPGRSERPARLLEESGPEGRAWRILDLGDRPFDQTPETALPLDAVFVLGDHRDNSRDSRDLGGHGPVLLSAVIGRASFIYFSTDFSRIGRRVE